MTNEELIAALEAADTADEAALIRQALDLALTEDWISREAFYRAQRMVDCEAYESAALTLVPEGFGVELRTYPLAPTGHKHTPMARVLANQSRRDPLRWDEAGIGDAPTPALALCIAALRARSAKP